jgi:hypothetical protein
MSARLSTRLRSALATLHLHSVLAAVQFSQRRRALCSFWREWSGGGGWRGRDAGQAEMRSPSTSVATPEASGSGSGSAWTIVSRWVGRVRAT